MTDRPLLPLIEDSCVLSSEALAVRLEDWAAALAGVTAADRTSLAAGRVVLSLGPAVDLAVLARLCALEVECCSFFAFSLTVTAEARSLIITVPTGSESALHEVLQVLPAALRLRQRSQGVEEGARLVRGSGADAKPAGQARAG